MSKSEAFFMTLFSALNPALTAQAGWWQMIREKAGIDPFEPDCPDHLLLLMDYYLKCQQKVFDRITLYCEQEIRKEHAALL